MGQFWTLDRKQSGHAKAKQKLFRSEPWQIYIKLQQVSKVIITSHSNLLRLITLSTNWRIEGITSMSRPKEPCNSY